jgi:hypothetical protein
LAAPQQGRVSDPSLFFLRDKLNFTHLPRTQLPGKSAKKIKSFKVFFAFSCGFA